MDKLAESVTRRYLQHQGIKVDYPEKEVVKVSPAAPIAAAAEFMVDEEVPKDMED